MGLTHQILRLRVQYPVHNDVLVLVRLRTRFRGSSSDGAHFTLGVNLLHVVQVESKIILSKLLGGTGCVETW